MWPWHLCTFLHQAARCRIPVPMRLRHKSSVRVCARASLFYVRPHDRKSHLRATSSACGFDKCCYPGLLRRIFVKRWQDIRQNSVSCTAEIISSFGVGSLLCFLHWSLSYASRTCAETTEKTLKCAQCRGPNNHVNIRILHLGQKLWAPVRGIYKPFIVRFYFVCGCLALQVARSYSGHVLVVHHNFVKSP